MSKKQKEKPKLQVNLASAIGDAYKEGYIDGLEEQADWIEKTEKILNWILKTPVEERIDFLIDSEIQRYFNYKRIEIKKHIGRQK